jgi:TRAP-type C4-dicarboxylate transport system permease small subunit
VKNLEVWIGLLFAKTEQTTAKIEAFLALVGSCGIPIILFLVAGNVIGRLVGVPLIFSNEISVYMMIPIVFLVSADTLRKGEHVRAELAIRRLPLWAQKGLEVVVELIALVITILILISCWQLAINSYIHNEVSNTLLRTPLYIPRILLAFGFSLFGLESLIRIVSTILSMRKDWTGQ